MNKASLILVAALASTGAIADVETVSVEPVAPQAVGVGTSTGTALGVSVGVGLVAAGTALSIASDDSTTPEEPTEPPVTTTTTTTTNTM